MGERRQRLAGEVSKFAATGLVATILALLLFNWLVHAAPGMDQPLLADHAILAYVVANSISMAVSYRLSRSWAFRHREPVGVAAGRLTFVWINVVTMLIPIGCLWLTRNVLEWETALADNLSANVVGLFLGFVARFYLFRSYVFVSPARTDRKVGTGT